MEAQPDFKEFLALLNDHAVEYIVVGAFALAFHGAPRFTGDIDLYVRPAPENAEKTIRALAAFGFVSSELSAEDFVQLDRVVQIGVPPVRLDLLTSLTGITWEEADAGKMSGSYGGVPVFFLGRAQYVKNKKATGRKKDLADLEAIGEA
ncbi:MAG: hypothetical protein ABSF77_06725 [Spirochaetia bacterium]